MLQKFLKVYDYAIHKADTIILYKHLVSVVTYNLRHLHCRIVPFEYVKLHVNYATCI